MSYTEELQEELTRSLKRYAGDSITPKLQSQILREIAAVRTPSAGVARVREDGTLWDKMNPWSRFRWWWYNRLWPSLGQRGRTKWYMSAAKRGETKLPVHLEFSPKSVLLYLADVTLREPVECIEVNFEIYP